MDEYLTIAETADVLRVSPVTIKSWIQDGKIRVIQPAGPGGAIRIPVSEIKPKNEEE